MKRLTAVCAARPARDSGPLASALAGDKAAYVGGTIARFNHAEHCASKGASRSAHATSCSFQRTALVPPNLSASTTNQSVISNSVSGRPVECRSSSPRPRFSVPSASVSLPAKSRAHYLTLTYAGEQGRTEVIVIELGKDVVRSTLAVVEARSGIPIEYQDEEARKWRR